MSKASKKQKHIYEPSVGVKTDFETLLQSFSALGTVRYEKFAECWRELNMSCYCAGRQTKREAREFVEQCFLIATQYWLPPSSFLVRSGALYLLYGLYYYQLVSPKAKIRVTPDQWKTITEFQEEAREQQHLDLDFVFQKLLLDKAFQFVAESEEVSQSLKTSEDARLIPESMKEETSTVEEIFTSSALNQLTLVHDQYHKMKLALSGDNATEPETSINIVNTDLLNGLIKTIQNHKERHTGIVKPQTSKQEDLKDVEDEKHSVYTPYASMSLKKQLKLKAFENSTFASGQSSDHSGSIDEDIQVKFQNAFKYTCTDKRPGKRHIPPLYDKDDCEEEPVVMSDVQELFCMPDLDRITSKTNTIKGAAVSSTDDSDMDTGVKNKKAGEDENTSVDEIEAHFKGNKITAKQMSNDSKKLSSKKIKPSEDFVEVKKEGNKRKLKPSEDFVEVKKEGNRKKLKHDEDFVEVKEGSAKSKNSKQTVEKDDKQTSKGKTTVKTRTVIHTQKKVDVEGESKMSAQEKLQQKLIQRKKEARLNPKTKKQKSM